MEGKMHKDKEKYLAALKTANKVIDDKFGEDIVRLDISNVSTLADYFIIASANNTVQMKAISEAVDEALHKSGMKMRQREGGTESNWLLLDCGGLIVHLFTKEAREFYNLEDLWGSAEVIEDV